MGESSVGFSSTGLLMVSQGKIHQDYDHSKLCGWLSSILLNQFKAEVRRCEAKNQTNKFQHFISSDIFLHKFRVSLIQLQFKKLYKTIRMECMMSKFCKRGSIYIFLLEAADSRKKEEASPTYTYNPFTSWIIFMLYRTFILSSAHRATIVLFLISNRK